MHAFIQQIISLFDAQGSQTYGEDINQIEHAVQCAELAIIAREPSELVASALLHDIGHLMAATDIAFGNYKHDVIGAEFLAPYFPKEVTEPIRLHAQAKRYLCAVDDRYLAGLSAASVDSLHNQGGLMSASEQQSFLQDPFAQASSTLRRWDDQGKVQELSKIGVRQYVPHLEAVILNRTKPA